MTSHPESTEDTPDDVGVDPHISVLQLAVTADAADMSGPAVAAGIEALSTALRDPDIRVIVLVLRPQEPAVPGAPAQASQLDALHDWVLALWDSDKPTLAALDAPISGAGLALALACDMLVASRDVRLRLAPALQVAGRGAAATWLATRRLPPTQAAALALGCELDAPRAHALGLVLDVTPAGLALERSLEIARQVAAETAPVLAEVRRQLTAAGTHTLSQALSDDRRRWLRARA